MWGGGGYLNWTPQPNKKVYRQNNRMSGPIYTFAHSNPYVVEYGELLFMSRIMQ